MQIPLEIHFRDVTKTERLEATITELAHKLESVHERLDSCRVAIEQPNTHQLTYRGLRVRIDLTVPPGHELVVSKESAGASTHDNIEALVREAFHVARRRLQRLRERQTGNGRRSRARREWRRLSRPLAGGRSSGLSASST